jgi:hypothetical protein
MHYKRDLNGIPLDNLHISNTKVSVLVQLWWARGQNRTVVRLGWSAFIAVIPILFFLEKRFNLFWIFLHKRDTTTMQNYNANLLIF